MQRNKFNYLKAEVAKASAAEILEFEHLIQQVVTQRFAEMALARRTKTVTDLRICPHCNGKNIICHGKDQNNRQRFKCRGCGKTHNILTGTPMARARKPEKWGPYLNFMTQHNSVRAIHAAGIGLNHVTIWRWRHRFLKAAINDNTALLCGVIEVDTTFFRRSFKGRRPCKEASPHESRAAQSRALGASGRRRPSQYVPLLTALDSSGGIFQAVLASTTAIETTLQGRVAVGSLLCSDGRAAYARVADRSGAEPWVISAAMANPDGVRDGPIGSPHRSRGRLGLSRVRAHHQQFRHLINDRCCGVATRYLGSYLGWHRAMVRAGFDGKALLIRALGS